jgi:hypothetical protein
MIVLNPMSLTTFQITTGRKWSSQTRTPSRFESPVKLARQRSKFIDELRSQAPSLRMQTGGDPIDGDGAASGTQDDVMYLGTITSPQVTASWEIYSASWRACRLGCLHYQRN